MKCNTQHCHHQAITGTEKCQRHTDETARVRRYRLTNPNLQERIDELTSVDYMASLKSEVALAQTMLEERLNACGTNPTEIIAAHIAVNSSLETINRLVTSMQKFDLATGEVLAKTALARLIAGAVDDIANEIEVFSDHPDYIGVMDRIEERLSIRIEEATNE